MADIVRVLPPKVNRARHAPLFKQAQVGQVQRMFFKELHHFWMMDIEGEEFRRDRTYADLLWPHCTGLIVTLILIQKIATYVSMRGILWLEVF